MFGMGTGVTFQIWSPERIVVIGMGYVPLSPAEAGDSIGEPSIRVVKQSSVSTG